MTRIEGPESGRGDVRVYGWSWGAEDERRAGIPWIGVFLVILGLLLLVERVVPQLGAASAAFFLAVGIVLLIRWAVERRGTWLYLGSLVTALAAPEVIEAFTDVGGPGLGAVCFGIAFAFIALVRWRSGGGLGWQAWLAAILVAWGGTRMAIPDLGAFLLPALLVALGAILVLRGIDRR
jgi:hypothetical protein